MKNKNGVKFISDKIIELELLAKSYADAMTEKTTEIVNLETQISNYRKMRNEVVEKIETYKTVLTDLEGTMPVVKPSVTRPAKSILGNANNVTNFVANNTVTNTKNSSSKQTEKVFAVVCKDADEFIQYCDNLKGTLRFSPKVKNTIAVQSDGKTTFVKVTSILDLNSNSFDYMVVLPNAKYNPEYSKIMIAIKMHINGH